jgi:hypothetical protein
MDAVSSHLSDRDRINWVTRLLRGSARDWYSIVQDQTKTYSSFVERFEARYWSEQVQRRVRHKLEFGRYHPTRLTKEQYVIRLLAECKHLRPEISEPDLINKIAHHFDYNIKVAIITRGIIKIEELLIFLANWDEMTRSAYVPTTSVNKNNNNNGNEIADHDKSNKKLQYNNKNQHKRVTALTSIDHTSESKNEFGCTKSGLAYKNPHRPVVNPLNASNYDSQYCRDKVNVYQVNNVYLHDMREALIGEVFENEGNGLIKNEYKGCPYILAQINGIWTKALIDSGAEITAVNQSFITQNKTHFKRASILPIINTQIQTATNVRENVNQQIMINLHKGVLNIDFAAVVVKKLMYDLITGIDVLRLFKAKIDVAGNILMCNWNQKEMFSN